MYLLQRLWLSKPTPLKLEYDKVISNCPDLVQDQFFVTFLELAYKWRHIDIFLVHPVYENIEFEHNECTWEALRASNPQNAYFWVISGQIFPNFGNLKPKMPAGRAVE